MLKSTYIPASTWFGRVRNFSKQMFPLYPNVLILLFQFIVNYMILQKFFADESKPEPVIAEIVVGGLGLVLFIFLFRVFDEIKDYPTDLINFPDRPLVVGVLSLSDIKILWKVLLIAILALHAPFFGTPVFLGYLAVTIFTLLASQWFFAEKHIRPSLPLALVTHNPIVYIIQFYILCYFSGALGTLLIPAVLFLIGEGLPSTAWEISRKIRGTTQEDTYTTYSKIWGPKVPTLLVAVLMLFSGILIFVSVVPQINSAYAPYLFFLPAVVWIVYVTNMVKYWSDPRVGKPFRELVEFFKVALMIVFVLMLFFFEAKV